MDVSSQDNPFTEKRMQDLSIDSLFVYNHTFISFEMHRDAVFHSLLTSYWIFQAR